MRSKQDRDLGKETLRKGIETLSISLPRPIKGKGKRIFLIWKKVMSSSLIPRACLSMLLNTIRSCLVRKIGKCENGR
jgi:hypothetical protein